MTGFADIHSHFIYDVDDGAKTRADMEAMLDAAHADGITSLFATPHVTPGLEPFHDSAYQNHLEEAKSYCQSKGYGMTLYPGAEIMYTPMLEQSVLNHPLPTLAGTNYVLLEFVPDISFGEMEGALHLLERHGYAPILAHIERYRCLYAGKHAARLKASCNVHYQINASTVLSPRGFFQTRAIRHWLRTGLVDFVASDAHGCSHRTFHMRKAYEALIALCGQETAAGLVGLKQREQFPLLS